VTNYTVSTDLLQKRFSIFFKLAWAVEHLIVQSRRTLQALTISCHWESFTILLELVLGKSMFNKWLWYYGIPLPVLPMLCSHGTIIKLCGRPPQYAPCKLTFDILTLKVVLESRVKLATSVPILVFLGLSVLDLGPIYATDRRQMSDVRQTSDAHHRLMPPTLGAGHNNMAG